MVLSYINSKNEDMKLKVTNNPSRSVTQLGLWVKILHGIGQIPNSIKTILFGIFSLYFYNTVMGLSGTLVGIATAVGLLWDAVIDPVIGTMSDTSQSRIGNRHSFMVIGAAFMGISFWAFFSPPAALSTGALFTWLLVTNLMVRTSTSIYSIPYYALGAELSTDYHERTSVTGIRGMAGLLGTVTVVVLSFSLFFPQTLQGDPKMNVDGYWAMGLFSGLLMTSLGLLSTFGTLSYKKNNPVLQAQNKKLRHFFDNCLIAWQNKSFRIIFISYSIIFIGIVVNATLSIYFLTYYVEITGSTAISIFHFSFYIGALAGVVFWMNISKTIEKSRLYFLGTLSTAMVMSCAFLFLGDGHLLGTGSMPPLCVGNGLAGFFASVFWTIPASLIADIADQDELISGSRREGIFFGLFNFGEQIAAGASIFITGFLIDWFAGFVPGLQPSAITVSRIGMIYSLLPAFLLAAAAFIILRYSLDRHKVLSIQLELSKDGMLKK
ncbi:MFS transporter [Desulfobacula sp.]|uniref:MFS transporter n=1 Tax=Desulfobacula sp. TaxID=2593537 RepID=UPI00261B6ADA|nr:MFS transporter [Desulfobacula sp.]